MVRDSITKEPIAYAALVYENTEIGTNANEKGEFELTKLENNFIINVSCLGYKTKTLQILNSNDIYLSPKQQVIQEVIISNKKNTSEIIVGNYKNSKTSFVNGGGSQIWAKFIKSSEEIKTHPFIKTIQFTTTSDVKAAKLKLRFLNTNSEGKPLDDIIFDEIIITVKKGTHKNIVNLENYKITIPKEGIFIGFENLIIEENKYQYTYTIEGSNKKMKGISYEPSIRGYEAKEYNVWYIKNDKSFLFNHKFKKDSKPIELGVKLTLTN